MRRFSFQIIILFIFLNLILYFGDVNGVKLDPVELAQLQRFFESTGGTHWTWAPVNETGLTWNFAHTDTNNPCQLTWQGITCDQTECPDEKGFCHIFAIQLNEYNLTGTLPSKIENFTHLTLFNLGSNNLRGPVPAFINAPNLQTLNLSYNAFDSKLPENFLDPAPMKLDLIYLSNNFISGPLPSVIFSPFTKLQYFNVYNNSFTGEISPDISLWESLFYLNLGTNQFRGKFPSNSLKQLYKLRQFYIDHNFFTGPIPDENYNIIEIYWVNNNLFSGTIPSGFCQYKNISIVKLEHNLLTGTLPSCISEFQTLSVLQVQDNDFHGPLDEAFNRNIHQLLTVLDISGNSFSGSFPVEIFQLPRLRSVAAVKNCFSGEIPESICDEENMNHSTLAVIALDGLHSSEYCIKYYWNPFRPSSSGSTATLMSGSIPCCLWKLPNITTLHFAGNGFTGTLPEFSTDLSPTLMDVSLSHNLLTGTIPEVIQQQSFMSVDFSYNKLHGSIPFFTQMPLPNNASSNGAILNLENNRLSGKIPNELVSPYNVQILNGNVFDCENLPNHDPNEMNYLCGSSEFDSASSIFGITVGFIVGIITLIVLTGLFSLRNATKGSSTDQKNGIYPNHHRRGNSKKNYQNFKEYLWKNYQFLIYVKDTMFFIQDIVVKTYYDFYNASYLTDELTQIVLLKYFNVYRFLYSLFLIQKISVLIAFFTVFFCLPVYLLFYYVGDCQYSKYEEKYSWITTSVFLTGEAPAATLMVIWYLILVVVLICIYYHFHIHYRSKRQPFERLKSFFSNSYSGRSEYDALSTKPDGDTVIAPLFRDSTLALLEQDDSDSDKFNNSTHSFVFAPSSDKHDPLSTPPPNFNVHDEHNANNNNNNTTGSNKTRSSFLSRYSYNLRESFRSPLQKIRKSFKSDRQSFLSIPQVPVSQVVDRMSDLVKQTEFRDRMTYYFLYFIMFVINAIVGVTVNAVYLLEEDADTMSSESKQVMQLFMAFFKLFWNIIIIRLMIKQLYPYQKDVTRLHVFMLVFNSILAPCLATAFTDSSCFKEVFTVADIIKTSYDLTTCTESIITASPSTGRLIPVCYKQVNLNFETSFTPSFIYYYSCGSKLLTAYIPVFIYTYTILLLASLVLYTSLAKVRVLALPKFILFKIDGVLRPKEAINGTMIFERLVKGDSIQALLTQHVVVLLTFGVNSPILATIMAITITIICFIWQLLIIRYVKYDRFGTSSSSSPNGTEEDATSVKEIMLEDSQRSSLTEKTPTSPAPPMDTVGSPKQRHFKKVILTRHLEAGSSNRIRKGSNAPKYNYVTGERLSDLTSAGSNSFGETPGEGKDSNNITDRTSLLGAPAGTTTDRSSFLGITDRISFLGTGTATTTDRNSLIGGLNIDRSSLAGKQLGGPSLIAPLPPLPPPLRDDDDDESIDIEFPSLNSSFRDSNTSLLSNNDGYDYEEFFQVNKFEEMRLNELNTVIDDSWLCIYHTRWLIFYISMIFYILVLYDFSGDQNGAFHALWVPSVILFLLLVTRFWITDCLRYVQSLS